ncbi:hypothetical protein ACIBH1_05805 [Nonomuraea sp. NPDC050663]|uniref:hypothetical protein n=1 Tax=Nonomuraea sp. NPDC050663 TaxID=3364370 RepID=UPI0037A4512D
MTADSPTPPDDPTRRVSRDDLPPAPPPWQQPGPYSPPPQGLPQYAQQPPSYPYPPTQYGPPQQWAQQPPPPAPRIRPSLWWVGGAWAIAVVCAAVGVGLFFSGVVSGITNAAPSRTFVAGETATVRLDPAQEAVLYYSGPSTDYSCKSLGEARLERAGGSQTITVNGLTWERLGTITVPSAGDYQFQCTAGQEQSAARFGIGAPLAGVVSGTGVMLILCGAGLAVGLATTILVVVRRRAARRRLLPSRM